MRGRKFIIHFWLALVLAGCVSDSAPSGGLEYNGPTEMSVRQGETLGPTNIQYVGLTKDGGEVLIGGQSALKKIGDSLDWQGTPIPGVRVALAQRVVQANSDLLRTVGTVKIVIDQVTPTPGLYPDQPRYSYMVPVLYSVGVDHQLPGTTIGYAGKAEEGARLTGVSGYAYRRLGDSISWRGRLRQGVFIDLTVRVAAYTDSSMQVTGFVTVGLSQE